jgi:hypothetical protein
MQNNVKSLTKEKITKTIYVTCLVVLSAGVICSAQAQTNDNIIKPIGISPAQSTGPILKFKELNVPLTIEDMSKEQRIALEKDHLKALGYTNDREVLPKVVKSVDSVKSKTKTEKITIEPNYIRLSGIYFTPTKQVMDVEINGKTYNAESGQVIFAGGVSYTLTIKSPTTASVSYLTKKNPKQKDLQLVSKDIKVSPSALEF